MTSALTNLDTDVFISEVLLSKKPSIVLFGSDGCDIRAACKRPLTQKAAQHPEFGCFYVNADHNPDVIRMTKIDFLPSVLVMVGKEVFTGSRGKPSDTDLEMMMA
jgi:hypothetical protein